MVARLRLLGFYGFYGLFLGGELFQFGEELVGFGGVLALGVSQRVPLSAAQ